MSMFCPLCSVCLEVTFEVFFELEVVVELCSGEEVFSTPHKCKQVMGGSVRERLFGRFSEGETVWEVQ